MNNNLFKILSSETRLKILKAISKKEMHVSGLAKELGISVPVTSRHLKILENSGLIERKIIGTTHLIKSKPENISYLLDELAESYELNVEKGTSIFDALKKISGIEVKKVKDKEFVVSIDGEQGFYIYEVNGKSPEATVEEYKIEADSIVEWKKLVPITKKKIHIKVKKGISLFEVRIVTLKRVFIILYAV